jgi:GrpB-like predicted nucleotidyltransferase (UPF0157 family)
VPQDGNPGIEDAVLIGGPERRDIVLCDYDPRWPERFSQERRRIHDALESSAMKVEHIGSTSVVGLAAKPIIDILLTVRAVDDEPTYLPALEQAGYVLRVRETGHRLLRTPELDVHLHVLSDGGPGAAAYLAFRDRLRASSIDQDLYVATKRHLATQQWPTMNHYAEAKSDVVNQILGRAFRVDP